jgi:predicted Ser/Thr protein kinase
MARLGQGGMGIVYLAQDPRGRPVAIKVVKPELAYEKEFRARFRSEVNRARQVPPFCTAELLDADPDHETPYLVVEYVDGPSLAEIVAEQGRLTGGNLHSVAVGVATALAAIHGAGVIHRDLKPANVLFALGTPKVIDFGIARAFEATSQHTGTDQMVGTVAYMAPERFDADSNRIGPAADVFAWGVVVAHAGTGRTPFGGDSAAATAGAILTRPPKLDGLPGPLRDLVARTLDKEPGRRPTAFELLDELVTAGAPTTVNLAGRPELQQAAQAALRAERHPVANEPTGVSSRRWRGLAPALAIVAVLAVAGVFTLTPARQVLFGDASQSVAGGSLPSATPRADTSTEPTTSPAPSASPSRTAGPAPTTRDPGPVVAPTLSKSPAASLCRDSDVAIAITAQSDNPTVVGPQLGLVTVENTSKGACRVDGRVFVGLYNAADERVTVPTAAVSEPGPVVEILLRPGTGAFQGIKWQACDRADSDCPTGNTLRGSFGSSSRGVVADLEGFPDPAESQITMKSIKVGTLQASRQGVVAW